MVVARGHSVDGSDHASVLGDGPARSVLHDRGGERIGEDVDYEGSVDWYRDG